jgi:hypothetical protein
MRSIRLAVLTAAALLLISVGAAFAASGQAPPGIGVSVVHPRWHRVARNVESIAPGGRYLALFGVAGTIRLYNKQTRTQTPLTTPGCTGSQRAVFGGPWLAFGCNVVEPSYTAQVDLYDLATATWTEVPLAPDICTEEQGCDVDGVGTTWIRFLTSDSSGHPTYTAYLQNIATGAVQPDPADSAYVQDNLNTPTGIGDPCVKLPSALQAAYLSGPDPQSTYWYAFGKYVLTTGSPATEEGTDTPDLIYKCDQGVVLHASDYSFASPDAVLHQNPALTSPAIFGRFLPRLNAFTIPKPKGRVVALSHRTLYTLAGRASLWAGNLTRR